MIYYFSGTGNSREVAKSLARHNNDTTVNITSKKEAYSLDNSTIGFVFPVYAWGIPKIMRNFITSFQFSPKTSYVYMVCTCGDDIGHTDKEMRELLANKGIQLDAAWSIAMPNTYISLPGFDIDSQEITCQKLINAKQRVEQIGRLILNRQRNIIDVTPGSFATFKSKILRPAFNKLLTGDKRFKVLPSCTHCGKCAKVCPTQNIHYNAEGLPTWNGNCTDCLACYHNCPNHAIEYGAFTHNKGQYTINSYLKKLRFL